MADLAAKWPDPVPPSGSVPTPGHVPTKVMRIV